MPTYYSSARCRVMPTLWWGWRGRQGWSSLRIQAATSEPGASRCSRASKASLARRRCKASAYTHSSHPMRQHPAYSPLPRAPTPSSNSQHTPPRRPKHRWAYLYYLVISRLIMRILPGTGGPLPPTAAVRTCHACRAVYRCRSVCTCLPGGAMLLGDLLPGGECLGPLSPHLGGCERHAMAYAA